MKIVFFSHPLFFGSQSMPRFTSMLAEGMKNRGHEIEIWRPEMYFSNMPIKRLKKWLGYVDQYLVFPQLVKHKLKTKADDVLYVVTDHALGPYVPLISEKPHVIHCHDFLAQYSALKQTPENIISAIGRQYQAYIRRGFSKGKNFISVSEKTRADLTKFLSEKPLRSEMVYNGLDPSYQPASALTSRLELGKKLNIDLTEGYLLHVGGNQWYKNRMGIIDMYDKWRAGYEKRLPLLLIGENPDLELGEKVDRSAYKEDIHFIPGLNDETVRIAYAGATLFLFPSLAEGFGWPIAEAMACGTLVMTTNEAPMLEVAGDAAFLINRRPMDEVEQEKWSVESARVLQGAISLDELERNKWIEHGMVNIQRFKLDDALDRIEKIYKEVLNAKVA